ncbi:MAG: hypothetical protein KGJ88_07245 [Verrucomicrobiota bacterium]|nr:hypothetical protein [Verrucomicrobiota bacterium]
MQEIKFDDAIDRIRARDPRYPRDAYLFVREALDFTQKLISRENRGLVRHVTGQELLQGIRKFAIEQFGPMAATVLDEWSIKECQDFGNIVFNMVEIGLLARTDKDSREDFENAYDFTEAFRKPFLPEAKAMERHPVAAPKK